MMSQAELKKHLIKKKKSSEDYYILKELKEI
jgi:hypothetical protein